MNKSLFFKANLLFLLLLGCCIKGISQIPKEPVTFQSPNAATLGLFGSVPVSHFTGLPQIEVPMYNFQENGITIPINLSYHASGFRPDMRPGWVGMGWNLSSTYAITRSVNDAPDDLYNPEFLLYETMGYFFNYNNLSPANWNQIAYMRTIIRSETVLRDTEPDEYSFNYPGGSGKFYLDHTGAWKVKCDKPVKVSFDGVFFDAPFDAPSDSYQEQHGNTKSFSGFTITDEKGTKYVFGKNTSAIEYSIGFFEQYYSEWIAQSWYLTKIINPEGYEVNLEYERDDYINQMYISIYNNLGTKSSTSGGILSPRCSGDGSWNESKSYNGKLISPVYLKTISGSNIKIDFVRSTAAQLNYAESIYSYGYDDFIKRWDSYYPFLPVLSQTPYSRYEGLPSLKFKKLDTIKIENTSGAVQKKFVLSYNNVSTERLILKSVTEVGSNNATKPPCLFYYDASVSLPPYLANKNDHWGFYNGTTASINPATDYYLTYYSKREPNAAYLYAGTLNKIIYPTGGVTEFIYEPNTYSLRLQEARFLGVDPSYNTNTLAGGLRIKEIVSYNINMDSVKNIKKYSYDLLSGSKSSGVLGGTIKYYFENYNRNALNDEDVVYSTSVFSSQSVLPGCTNAQGSHIGYSIVRETLSDKSYTDYYFTNFDNGRIDDGADASLQPTRTAYEPSASREAERGNLYKEENYSSDSVLLRKKEISYISLNKENEYIRSLKCNIVGVCTDVSISAEEGTAYKIYTYSYLPSQEKITQYDQSGNNPVVTDRYFSYNSYRLLVKDSTFDSNDQNLQTYYRYPFDVLSYTPGSSVSNTQPVAYMVQQNIIGSPVEIIHTKKVSGTELVMASQAMEFKNYHTFVKPYRQYNFNNPSPAIAKSSYTNYAIGFSGGNETITKDSRLEQRVLFENYDTKGNILDISKFQDVNTSYQWDYNQSFPTVKIVNAYNRVNKNFFYNGFEEDVSSATANPFAGKKYHTGDYTIPFAAPDGDTYYVNYYSLQSGVWVKVTKQFFNYLTLAEGDAIDEVRVYPVDAQMFTYTYDPIAGMTSETDLNGLVKLYEYDEFQRLVLVRDQDKNILKKIEYTYAEPTLFYSVFKSKSFTRTNCASCLMGGAVPYVALDSAYSSVFSQADADQKAQDYIDANGQAYANNVGTCTTPSPVPLSGWNYTSEKIYLSIRNNCTGVSSYFELNPNAMNVALSPLPGGDYSVSQDNNGGNDYQFRVNSQIFYNNTAGSVDFRFTSNSIVITPVVRTP